MDLHVQLAGRRDLARQLYAQLRTAILDGRLRNGERLPSTRALAERLGIARNTVTLAYAWLAAQELVVGRKGGGTVVQGQRLARPGARGPGTVLRVRSTWTGSTLPASPEPPSRYDFGVGVPDASLFPFDTWRRLLARQIRPSRRRRHRLVCGTCRHRPAGRFVIGLALLLIGAAPATAADAERAFAASAQTQGQWTAFRAFADAEAIMFTPQPVKAQAWLAEHQGVRTTDYHGLWRWSASTAMTLGSWGRLSRMAMSRPSRSSRRSAASSRSAETNPGAAMAEDESATSPGMSDSTRRPNSSSNARMTTSMEGSRAAAATATPRVATA